MARANYRSIFPSAILVFWVVGIGIFWMWIEQSKEEGGYPMAWVALLWIFTLTFFLTIGNILVYRVMKRYYSWESYFNYRFFFQVLLSLIYSLACINISYLLFKNHFTELPPDRDQMILLNIYGILFIIPLLSIQFGIMFLRKWKSATMAQEGLKQAKIQSELIALRAHISPHFLFNNLNILSSLIAVNNFEAQDHLEKFSEVYRYVLNNRKQELAPLSQELSFLDAYIYLLRKRFTTGLTIEIDIPPSAHSWLLPPLTLQVLLENALKHNKLSKENPLVVSIFLSQTQERRLVISNNIQERIVEDIDKSGFGLEHVKRRYWLISGEEIEIHKDKDIFKVILPLLPNA